MQSSDFVNHSYDCRPNWTPLSPVTITNNSYFILYGWVRNLESTFYFTAMLTLSPSNPTDPLSFIKYVLLFFCTEHCNYI